MTEECVLQIQWKKTITLDESVTISINFKFEKECLLPIHEKITSLRIKTELKGILILDEIHLNNSENLIDNILKGNVKTNHDSAFLIASDELTDFLEIGIPSTSQPCVLSIKGYFITQDSSLFPMIELFFKNTRSNSIDKMEETELLLKNEPNTKLGLLLMDISYGFELLRREGLKSFVHRIFWYIRGKRLIEDIYASKINKTINQKPTKNPKIPIVFTKYDEPLVSIIIPVHNQWDYTYNCLKSIYENTYEITYEIIVADDCSTDKTTNIESIIQNITVIRNTENLHFLKNCNNAAKSVKGKYILFLNNDVVVHPDWLGSLVGVAENDEKVGIVGSKLIFPDGTLQEAGGIIWTDASGWNYGKFKNAQLPEYNYLKETDYVSGACLLVRKSLWEHQGGFDERFVPAYYEDTDLSFTIRQMGYKVIYQPLSVITHFEGISHGKKISEGVKKFQEENKIKFLAKWQTTLKSEHSANGMDVFTARERSSHKKQILIIDHYVPHYDKDAGSRSTFSYIKLLVKMGFNVKFIGDNFYPHEPYTTELQQMGVEVLHGTYYQHNINSWIKENGHYFDFVFLHRMHIAPKYLDSLKKHSTAKLIYIGHDLNYLSNLRKHEVTKNKELLRESSKFKTIEKYIFDLVDIILPFSSYEAPFIKELVPTKIVETIPVYFYDNIIKNVNPFENRRDLLFVGGFGHPPNVDAIKWFIKDIFSLIQQKIQGIKIYVVGSNPTKEVLELANDAVIITGFVSDEELERYYKSCKVAVLPLRFGAGVKGKLLEACYHQIPAVITPIAAEGVPEIEKYTCISNMAEDFANKLNSLYSNPEIWSDYSAKGKELIQLNYSEKAAKKILQELLT